MNHMFIETRSRLWLKVALPLAVAATLAACGGGGGGSGGGGFFPIVPPTTQPPVDMPPVTPPPTGGGAVTVDSFIAYVRSLVGTTPETTEPANVAQFDPAPTSDTTEPASTATP